MKTGKNLMTRASVHLGLRSKHFNTEGRAYTNITGKVFGVECLGGETCFYVKQVKEKE